MSLQFCLKRLDINSPSTSQDPYRLSQRNSLRVEHSFTRKNNYHTRKPFLIIRKHKGIISWGLLPPIGGQPHVAILAGYFKYGACFPLISHNYLHCTVYWHLFTLRPCWVPTSYPTIIFYDGANYLTFANDLAKPLRPKPPAGHNVTMA